jgi:4-hydroxybenzoate polyprenyltransferase
MQSEARHEGQTYRGASLAARYASFVKLPHTLFALPFAGVGAVLASHTHAAAVTIGAIGWIVLAFTAARFAAMGFNRIVDRELDSQNPRTSARELPAGRLTLSQAATAVVVAAALFVLAAWMLNPLCGWLAPLALAWLFFYSYTKRFTSYSHHVLGAALGIAPAGAYLAIAGEWSQPWFALPVLVGGVTFWVAGFDVIYAVQDEAFDRRTGLHSLPARYGAARALRLARLFHAAACALFASIAVFRLFPVGPLYAGGVAVLAALLIFEHRIIGGDPERLDLPRIDRAFFHANVAVSSSFFLFTLMDRLL